MLLTKKKGRGCMESVKKKEIKKCTVCGYDKWLASFIFLDKNFQAVESCYCSECNTLLRITEKYCDKVLDGVRIPYFETPVTKSNLNPSDATIDVCC